MICYHSQPQFEEKKVTDLTIEEKLAHLQTAAMEEARAEGSAIIRQHQNALEELFREDYRKGTGQAPYHIDRKRRRKLAEKKQAQGHKRDDHEPVQQQSL